MVETKNKVFEIAFGPQSMNWFNGEDLNRLFLRGLETWQNQKLAIHGYLFLNDLLDDLGLGRIREGQSVGWFGQQRGQDKVGIKIASIDETGTLHLKIETEGDILYALPEA